jgi:cytoskeletal protein CcmA (bactofilin family)
MATTRQEDKTIIGPTITVDGEIDAEGGVVVLGRVTGKLRSAEDVVVDAGGEVEAEVEAEAVAVAGRLVGPVDAKSRVEISAEGRVTGDLRAPRILIADGAQYKGNIDMG